MHSSLVYQVALTMVPQIGPVQARQLLHHFDAAGIFKSKRSVLERIEGIGSIRADAICSFRDFSVAEREALFIERKKIKPLFLTDPDYPQRLLNCYDPPTLLYLKGDVNLNVPRVVGVIGTRNHTEYGRKLTEKLIADLEDAGILVISGLAYGIDAIAHKTALKHGLPTVGVLAHGLTHIYPSEHIPMAKEMIECGGGLITEFNSTVKPDKHNFPIRNRIVAGVCDAIVVVETGIKGGSMITADLANGYNRDVFAFPGKTFDAKSVGCHWLIRNNKAVLITGAADLVEAMGWGDDKKQEKPLVQRALFVELNKEESAIAEVLKNHELMHIDELAARTGFTPGTIASTLLSLEFKGVVSSAPGKTYRLM